MKNSLRSLDENPYRSPMIPGEPAPMSPEEIQRREMGRACYQAMGCLGGFVVVLGVITVWVAWIKSHYP